MLIRPLSPYRCRECGHEIGRLVDCNGVLLLEAGGAYWSEAHKGNCLNCGAAVHFSSDAKALERMLKG